MFCAFSFPIGVVFYWLTTNVLTILQQQFILGKVTIKPSPAGAISAGLDGSSSEGPAKLAKKPPGKASPGKAAPGKTSPGNGAPERPPRSQANRKKKKK
jgi:membrane protein insertase Oxa1/YidC/SpoIIIJ